MQKQLAISKNGITVTYDPASSHAATHFADTLNLKDLVIEVINRLELRGQEISRHFDMGRIVGTSDVVSVKKGDEVVYGIRINRSDDGLVPFVKNRKPDACQYVSVHLIPQDNETYIVSSAWIGTFGGDDEPFPQSPNANERSVDCWNKYAFVYGTQKIAIGTETAIKPW